MTTCPNCKKLQEIKETRKQLKENESYEDFTDKQADFFPTPAINILIENNQQLRDLPNYDIVIPMGAKEEVPEEIQNILGAMGHNGVIRRDNPEKIVKIRFHTSFTDTSGGAVNTDKNIYFLHTGDCKDNTEDCKELYELVLKLRTEREENQDRNNMIIYPQKTDQYTQLNNIISYLFCPTDISVVLT